MDVRQGLAGALPQLHRAVSATPLRIGLTGGVASGKSAAADRLAELGATVFDADRVNRELLDGDAATREAIVAAFGPAAIDAGNRIDRAALRRIIFADPTARRRLEAIMHPRVERRLRELAAGATSSLVVIPIPLLAEVGAYPWLDRILVVDCPESVQRERLIRRDRIDAALAQSMIAAQASRAQRLALADDVVVNDGALPLLRSRCDRLQQRYQRR
jgi:dephospho-CoA kinase